MASRFFRHRDADYAAWRDAHIADGFIVNIDESYPERSRVHRASCHTLQIPIDKGQELTGPYPKLCSTEVAELRREAPRARSCSFCSP
jgi:hypothetical protein